MQATLNQATEKVQVITYLLTDPIHSLFKEVKDLCELSEAAHNPLTDHQLLEIGLTVIHNTNDFERAQIEWHNKPQVDKTWMNFKTHFSDALERVRGDKMKTSAFRQANALIEANDSKLHAKLEGMQEQLLAALQEREEDQENIDPNTNNIPTTD